MEGRSAFLIFHDNARSFLQFSASTVSSESQNEHEHQTDSQVEADCKQQRHYVRS